MNTTTEDSVMTALREVARMEDERVAEVDTERALAARLAREKRDREEREAREREMREAAARRERELDEERRRRDLEAERRIAMLKAELVAVRAEREAVNDALRARSVAVDEREIQAGISRRIPLISFVAVGAALLLATFFYMTSGEPEGGARPREAMPSLSPLRNIEKAVEPAKGGADALRGDDVDVPAKEHPTGVAEVKKNAGMREGQAGRGKGPKGNKKNTGPTDKKNEKFDIIEDFGACKGDPLCGWNKP
jgi:hypothetical protein